MYTSACCIGLSVCTSEWPIPQSPINGLGVLSTYVCLYAAVGSRHAACLFKLLPVLEAFARATAVTNLHLPIRSRHRTRNEQSRRPGYCVHNFHRNRFSPDSSPRAMNIKSVGDCVSGSFDRYRRTLPLADHRHTFTSGWPVALTGVQREFLVRLTVRRQVPRIGDHFASDNWRAKMLLDDCCTAEQIARSPPPPSSWSMCERCPRPSGRTSSSRSLRSDRRRRHGALFFARARPSIFGSRAAQFASAVAVERRTTTDRPIYPSDHICPIRFALDAKTRSLVSDWARASLSN